LLLIRLVVNHEALCQPNRWLSGHSRRNAKLFNIPPQHPHAERVERRNGRLGNGKAADQLVHALDHFLRSFVGKGHGQDGFRHHTHVFDEICDTKGNDPGRAAARAREDEHRPVGCFDGGTLLRIELVEKRQMWSGSRVP
jgi:hypothetical protein